MNNQLKQAFSLRQNQDWQQALKIYEPLWESHSQNFDEWSGWSFAFCYSKSNQHHKALKICQQLYPRFKRSEILNSLYAKSIYYTQFIEQKQSDKILLKKATDAIYRLAPPVNPYSYAPRAIFKYCKILMDQMKINWEEIETYLKKLDPDLLDNQSFRLKNKKGKMVELASPREEWYSLMIRTQGGLNQPEEMLATLESARKQNIKWHYNNDIWFSRKEAFALYSLGEKERAIKILRRILLQKQSWFLYYDLAEMLPESREKLEMYCQAALASGKLPHKLKLYSSFGEYLTSKDKDTAELHYILEVLIRDANNWQVQQEKQKYLKLSKEKNLDLKSVLSKLKTFWKNHLPEKNKPQEGIIEFVFPHQKSGFLKTGNKKIFFLAGKLEGQLNTGISVSYILKDSFDKKRNKTSKMAVSLELLKP